MLANQRNNVIHSGEEILPMYIYDRLMIAHVLPIIKSVLEIESCSITRKNFSEIDVLEELVKIKLPKKVQEVTLKVKKA